MAQAKTLLAWSGYLSFAHFTTIRETPDDRTDDFAPSARMMLLDTCSEKYVF
jgi:hypothetical protein